MVSLETPSCSVGPTAKLSILNPRRANRPEIRLRAPDSSSTNTERCASSPPGGFAQTYLVGDCCFSQLIRALLKVSGASSWGQCPPVQPVQLRQPRGRLLNYCSAITGGTSRSRRPQSSSSGRFSLSSSCGAVARAGRKAMPRTIAPSAPAVAWLANESVAPVRYRCVHHWRKRWPGPFAARGFGAAQQLRAPAAGSGHQQH